MTAATDRSVLLHAIEAAMEAVKKNPRPETYRAMLEAQNKLQRYDLSYGRGRSALRNLPNRTRLSKLRG